MIEANEEMCFFCFEKLLNAVKKCAQHFVTDRVMNSFGVVQSDSIVPLFVKWKINNDTRGCIGCFDGISLIDGLKEYSISAGMLDWRFSPISFNELLNSECTVYILNTFEDLIDFDDWDQGVHGLQILIDGLSASFLPEETVGESKKEVIMKLAKKAGFFGEIDHFVLYNSTLKRFQVSSSKATWNDYVNYIESCV